MPGQSLAAGHRHRAGELIIRSRNLSAFDARFPALSGVRPKNFEKQRRLYLSTSSTPSTVQLLPPQAEKGSANWLASKLEAVHVRVRGPGHLNPIGSGSESGRSFEHEVVPVADPGYLDLL